MGKGRVWLGAAVLAAGVGMLALAVVATRDSGPATATTPTPAVATPAASATAAPTPESLVCTDAALGEARAANPALAADCDALLGLRDALAGDAALNWRADLPLAEWEGVGVDVKPRRVVSLWLTRKGLTGTLPPALGQLTHLTALGINHNRLTGTIPSALGNLTRLTLLHLNDNQLTGAIPPTLRRLTQLQQLWLHRNRLDGPIPASFRRLTKLTELNLHTNRLGGALPWQLGTLPALTYLNLHTNRFSGELPPELGRLALYQLWLGGNGFTGCAPGGLWNALAHDLDATGLPNCAEPPPLRYGAPEPSGIVDAPGEYAFFSADGPVTTYEGLRRDVAQLVIHQRDADGASWEAFYDGVEAGDDFEWREADDCWVRYLVDEVLPDPADAPLKVLAVRWITYAYTGCSGTVAATGDRNLDWGPLPDLGGPSLTIPVRHGPYLLHPAAPPWGNLQQQRGVRPPDARIAGAGEASSPTVTPRISRTTSDLADAKLFPYWRNPTLPNGWTLMHAETGTDTSPEFGYFAFYANERGYLDIQISVRFLEIHPIYRPSYTHSGSSIYETRLIDGHTAIIRYSPDGPKHSRNVATKVHIFDMSVGIEYRVYGHGANTSGEFIDTTIEIARSLYRGIEQ